MAYHRGEKRLVSVVAVKRHGNSSDQADNLNRKMYFSQLITEKTNLQIGDARNGASDASSDGNGDPRADYQKRKREH